MHLKLHLAKPACLIIILLFRFASDSELKYPQIAIYQCCFPIQTIVFIQSLTIGHNWRTVQWVSILRLLVRSFQCPVRCSGTVPFFFSMFCSVRNNGAGVSRSPQCSVNASTGWNIPRFSGGQVFSVFLMNVLCDGSGAEPFPIQ